MKRTVKQIRDWLTTFSDDAEVYVCHGYPEGILVGCGEARHLFETKAIQIAPAAKTSGTDSTQ